MKSVYLVRRFVSGTGSPKTVCAFRTDSDAETYINARLQDKKFDEWTVQKRFVSDSVYSNYSREWGWKEQS